MNKIPRAVWLDCDPGHDDAFAILLAATSKEIDLIGVSVVHGNDRAENCAKNVCRFLWTCGLKGLDVYVGVEQPLVRKGKHCPEIHGTPGEQGVSGMCGYHFPDEVIFANPEYNVKPGNGVLKMVEKITAHLGSKVSIVATGAQTNIALALRLFPQIKEHIEEIVFMGGAIGIGNTSVSAEFNIELDPEAAHIVLHSGVKIVMLPLEITHSVLVTDTILKKIQSMQEDELQIKSSGEPDVEENLDHPHIEYKNIFERLEDIRGSLTECNIGEVKASVPDELFASQFAKCCVELLTFFKSTYKKVFSFNYPPIHDPCAVFYVISPESFQTTNMFVDVELSGFKCAGRTLCDIHGILNKEPNVLVCTRVNVNAFWRRMLASIRIGNKFSPLNV